MTCKQRFVKPSGIWIQSLSPVSGHHESRRDPPELLCLHRIWTSISDCEFPLLLYREHSAEATPSSLSWPFLSCSVRGETNGLRRRSDSRKTIHCCRLNNYNICGVHDFTHNKHCDKYHLHHWIYYTRTRWVRIHKTHSVCITRAPVWSKLFAESEPWEWCYDDPSCNEEAWKKQAEVHLMSKSNNLVVRCVNMEDTGCVESILSDRFNQLISSLL